MNKTEKLQKIKFDLMRVKGWTTQQAVEEIAKNLKRSTSTIYDNLSIGRASIPDNSLELLKLKLDL